MRFSLRRALALILGSSWPVLAFSACTPVVHETRARPISDSGAGRPVPGAPAGVTAFVDVAVVPMDRDRVLPHQTVLVTGGRITALGPLAQVRVPAGAVRVDGRGQYLIPGLADMHAHLLGDSATVERALLLLVANGITTIRNMNAYAVDSFRPREIASRYGQTDWYGAFLRRLRARAAAGALVSPRLYTSSPWAPRQYIHPEEGDPPPRLDSIAAYVAAYKAAGYDFLKLREETPVIAESAAVAARRVGIPVVGHCTQPSVVANLKLGYTSIEHLCEIPDSEHNDSSVFRMDSSVAAGVAAIAKQAGVWNCPTLGWTIPYHYRPQLLRDTIAIPPWPAPPQFLTSNTVVQAQDSLSKDRPRFRFVRALQAAGAGLLAGSDAGDVSSHMFGARTGPFLGYSLHWELELLVWAGLTPYQALATSTRNAAAYFGTLAESGTVVVGKRADLVLLAGNPLADIQMTSRITGVMLGGRWLPRTAMEAPLAGALEVLEKL